MRSSPKRRLGTPVDDENRIPDGTQKRTGHEEIDTRYCRNRELQRDDSIGLGVGGLYPQAW